MGCLLAENLFAQKSLAELVGTPLPPLMENRRKFLPSNGRKGAKEEFLNQKFLYQIRLRYPKNW